jgi:outer membrane protein assembly factor BamB
MPRRFTTRAMPLVLLMATALTGGSATAGLPPTDPMTAPVRCEDGRALARTAEGLALVVGTCDPGAAASPPSATVPAHRAVEGPTDCLVPGYDDRCETWAAPRYDGPWSSADYPGFGGFDRHTTMLTHPTKDLLFLGGTSTYTNGGLPDADFVEIAYRASTGQPAWTTTYEGLGELTLAYQHSMALSPDGERLYALGSAAEPGVYRYSTIVAAFETATGTLLWARRMPISAESLETAMTTLEDGTVEERIYLGGIGGKVSPTGAVVVGGAVAAVNPADGSAIWTSVFPGETNGSRFNEVAVSPDGSTVFGTGGEHRPDGLAGNFATVAFEAVHGEKLWEARDALTQPNGFFGNNGASDMKVSRDGSLVIIAGLDPVSSGQLTVPSSSPILTIAHDASTGEVVWRRSYGGPIEGETHFYFSLFQGMMGLSPDGRTVVVTAAINSHNSTGTVAYDVATGTQRWGVESVEHGYVFTNYLGYYPAVAVGHDRAFVSNRRGIGYSQYRTVTTAYTLGSGDLEWTARLGTNRTLFGGNAIARDGRGVYVSAADQLYSVGFPVPDPPLDSVDIVTVAYGP